jgi:uncharacterized protein with HEPN domain
MAYPDLLSRLEDIRDASDEALRFTADTTYDRYLADALMRRAVERCIEIVSEASRHIPPELKARHPEMPWRSIADIGNVLRHGYQMVDHWIIWSVVQDHLPALRPVIEAMLRDVETDDRA